jgi:hypothetical protein
MTDLEVKHFLASFELAWSTLDPDALEQLFDLTETAPIYLAEECKKRFENWQEVTRYWKHTSEYVKRAKLTVTDVAAPRSLAQSYVLLAFDFHLDAELHSYASLGQKPLGIDIRVNAVLRKTARGEWKVTHYFEGAMGQLAGLRRLLETQVRADYAS